MRDLNLESCRLLVVGINPGLLSEQVNAPFARPGNRFWPALHAAGITEWLVDARHGLATQDEAMLIMIAGIGAYRTAFSRPKAKVGLQEEPIGGVETWVVPNPSGLNAHETVDSLARAYAEVWARLEEKE